jgi:hypothetical protein
VTVYQFQDLLIWVVIVGYFLPSLIALVRWHKFFRVVAMNVLFGWSLWGWGKALQWALW